VLIVTNFFSIISGVVIGGTISPQILRLLFGDPNSRRPISSFVMSLRPSCLWVGFNDFFPVQTKENSIYDYDPNGFFFTDSFLLPQ
jgi:hypothetical protein